MMSAGMDTVTEHRMAIAMARQVESESSIRICLLKPRQRKLIR